MSDFDFVNFLMIDDVGRSTKNNEHLQDLRDRAAHLAKVTGQEPVSWYEFKQNIPKEEGHNVRNAIIGAAIGVGIGALFLNPVLAVSLGFTGGALGAFNNTENRRRDTLVRKYEAYLDGFEASVGRGRGMSQGMGGFENTKTSHAAELLAERQKPQNHSATL